MLISRFPQRFSVLSRVPALLLGALLSSAAQAGPLVTPEEAARPPMMVSATRAITRGPTIRQVSPDASVKTLKSPMELKVAFEPRGGSKIDLDSVQVIYLKTPTVDLLERVKSGLSEKGLELSDVGLPPGDHSIQLTVQDNEGRRGTTVLNLRVVK